ncbi:glycosyltransferase, partial [Candidatus Bipolaricaulota bacterium]|nr:glycosyltransferase [Candidatus Bipolaricaulota bacterium]
AASRFLQMNRSVHFVMVGRSVSRDNTELTKYLQESIGSKRVHLLGERSDIERVMPALDIYTSASHSEAFSITIGEAMACGIPCVVTDVGDSAMIVGETGYVIEPRNPEALIEAWQHMVRIEQAGRTALGEKARMRIIDHFSLKRVVQMYASMYDEILQNQ